MAGIMRTTLHQIRLPMTADDTRTTSRPLRIIGGAVVTLAGLAILAVLLAAGVVSWMFGVALPGTSTRSMTSRWRPLAAPPTVISGGWRPTPPTAS
jgi:hypothetical protein